MKKVEVGKDAAIEAEVKAARERAVVPVEIRMKQFRDMLAEKEVSYNGGLMLTCSPISALSCLGSGCLPEAQLN